MRTRDLTLQPPFAPAALPQLDILRSMNTVCPSCQCPPTMPTAPPRSLPSLAAPFIRPLSAFHKEPLFAYVSDRLRSSEIVRAHRRPPPAIPAELPKCSPDSACQTGKKRVTSRQNAREKKASPRHLGVVDTPKYWSTNLGIYSKSSFSANFSSTVSLRADLRASRSRHLCPSQESDELYFRQMSASTGNSKLKTQNQQDTPSRKKKIPRLLGTFGDIWGHMSHFHANNERTSVP